MLKLRALTPTTLPRRERKSSGFTVELDAMPGGYVCSGTWKRGVGNMDVRQAVAGTRPLSALFPAKHRAVLSQHAPAGLAFDKLSVLGRILVLKLKFDPEEYQRRLVAELWMYPDNSRVLELSTKCDPQEAFLVAAETRERSFHDGVSISRVSRRPRRCGRSSSLRRGLLTRPRGALRRPPQGDDAGQTVEFEPQ
jgi:hypothetical protein